MKPGNFDYVSADSVQEVCELLQEAGHDARIIAGGQSLGAMLNMRVATPSILVDINRIGGLDEIKVVPDMISTGATVRQAKAMASSIIRENVPLLALALPHVGHFQTRSRGTLAGSVAHADPSAEIPLVLSILGGSVELATKRRQRKVAAREFFVSSLTTLREDNEMIIGLHWPKCKPGDIFGFKEHALRAGDFAIVAAASHLAFSAGSSKRLTLGFSGCGDKPQILTLDVPGDAAEAWCEHVGNEARKAVVCQGDLHASKDYRSQLVAVLGRALAEDALALGRGRSGHAKT